MPQRCGHLRTSEEISEALAKRLAQIVPRAADDENAQIAPFVDPQVASRINSIIEQGLTEPGARDVTAAYRDGGRLSGTTVRTCCRQFFVNRTIHLQ